MNDATPFDSTKLIVLTGGPGAGKTAILEMAKKIIGEKSIILPEAALDMILKLQKECCSSEGN